MIYEVHVVMTLTQDESEIRRKEETQYQQRIESDAFLSISQVALLTLR